MIKYIVGGVALVTAGYTLKRYLSKYDFHISIKNKNQNNPLSGTVVKKVSENEIKTELLKRLEEKIKTSKA